MKFVFLVFLSVFGVIQHTYSQSVSYSYDESGNRVLKTVTNPAFRLLGAKNNVIQNTISLEQENCELSVSVDDEDEHCEILVYNTYGVFLESIASDSKHTKFSLKDYPPGIYVIHVKGKKSSKTYKIITK